MDAEDMLIFTVDDLVEYLTNRKNDGMLTGKEPILDTGYFGITHVGIHREAATPFVTLESEEINEAERFLDAMISDTSLRPALDNIII